MVVKTCPVCDMAIQQGEWSESHLGITYVFCSNQCMQNFCDRALLYTGKHRHERLVHRRFHLAMPLGAFMADMIQQQLGEMMGMKKVVIEGDQISLSYDLVQCRAKQIEALLMQAGHHLAEGWTDRFKRGWMQYTEQNELDNLIEKPASCCNRAPAKR